MFSREGNAFCKSLLQRIDRGGRLTMGQTVAAEYLVEHYGEDMIRASGLKCCAGAGGGFVLSMIQLVEIGKRAYTPKQRAAVDRILSAAPPETEQSTMTLRELFPTIRKAVDASLEYRQHVRIDLTSLTQPLYFSCSREGRNAKRIAVSTGAYAGENTVFLGWIAEDGGFDQGRSCTPAHRLSIAQVDQDFAGHAGEHGRATGSCSFCARNLTTTASLAVGYGPVCAGRHGLPWG